MGAISKLRAVKAGDEKTYAGGAAVLRVGGGDERAGGEDDGLHCDGLELVIWLDEGRY